MYQEDKMTALPYRRRVIEGTDAYIASMRKAADERRAAYFTPDFATTDAYAASINAYRRELIAMLGRPLTEYPTELPINAERILVDDSDDCTLERLFVECAPGLWSYGLLFVPKSEGKLPYVTALHGGEGTCEIVSSLYSSGNYNDLVKRIRKATGAIVYVPQLMLWGEQYDETAADRNQHLERDYALKQVGGSIAALEIFKIMRTVDWLCENLPIDQAHMGIAGLSYGGFYALFTAACDPRYGAVLSSGFFNDRYAYCWGDWHWFDCASKLLDSEIARMICPRALCIEVGEKDLLFKADPARRQAETVAGTYARLGIPEKFRFTVHPGVHEFNRDNADVEWFAKQLR